MYSDLCADIVSFDSKLENPLVKIQGLRCTTVDQTVSTETNPLTNRKLVHQLEWKPDIRPLKNDKIEQLCNEAYLGVDSMEDFYTEVDFIVLARVLEALDVLSKRDFQPSKPHLRKYLQWARTQKHLLGNRPANFLQGAMEESFS